jgi:hypothetical protein
MGFHQGQLLTAMLLGTYFRSTPTSKSRMVVTSEMETGFRLWIPLNTAVIHVFRELKPLQQPIPSIQAL